MSAARRRELADEAAVGNIHLERYHHKHSVHEPYMSFLLEHVLTTEEEMTPSNLSLYEEIDGKMQRRDYHPNQAAIRAQLVNQALRLGFSWHPTKKTWHLQPSSQVFKNEFMTDGVNFTRQARDKLEKMSYRGETLLTPAQIDRVEHFLASCLGHRETTY